MTRAGSPSTESGVLSPKCAIRRVRGGQRLASDSRFRRSEPVFSSSATHSTWCVIGNRSKARSARQPVAVLGEGRQVPGERGRVAGDVRHGARGAVRDLLDDLAAGALPRRVEDDQVERLVVRRREHPVDRPGMTTWPRAGRRGCRGRARTRSGRPRPRPPGRSPPPARRGTPRTGPHRRRGRAPSPPAAAPASPAPSRPGSWGRRGAPARSRRPRRRTAGAARSRRPPATPESRSRPGAAIRQRSIGTTSRERCLRIPRLPSRATAYSIRVRQARPSTSPGTASTTTSTSSLASREQLLPDHGRLEGALAGQGDVLEVAATAEPGAGEAARRLDPLGRGRRAPRRRRRARSGPPRFPR